MNIIRFSIEKPVTVIVGIILVVLFGWIGLQRMPYQLSPTVIEGEITVTTVWPGATPYEIEREIIEEQEKVLKGIPNLLEMESSSFNSQGTVTLKFSIGTDVNNALLRVSNDRYAWYLNQHHVVTDAWSFTVIYQRMEELYRGIHRGGEETGSPIPPYAAYLDHELAAREVADPAAVNGWKAATPPMLAQLYGISEIPRR